MASKEVAPRICDYVKEGDELETDGDLEEETNKWTKLEHREKRQIDQYEYTPTKTRCPLLLVADYRFFQEMGGSNTKTTINYLVSASRFEVDCKCFLCFMISFRSV